MLSLKDTPVIKIINDLSLTEKTIFYILLLIFIVSGFGLIFKQANSFFEAVPLHGGSLEEGIVGYPRYINPLLSIVNSGRDINALVFAGLFREGENGRLINDLAESYEISEDGRTYNVFLKKNLKFHDGTPLTADDVVFTVEKAKDPFIKSPEFANWQGIAVAKVDDHHVQFILPSAYPPFLQNLTLGIMPQHIWENLNAEEFAFSRHNNEPIGAGPYKLIGIEQNSNNIIYRFRAFDQYALGKPYIENINIHAFKDLAGLEDALRRGEINSAGGLSPSKIEGLNLNGKEVKTMNLLRTFAVFFNQNQSPVLLNKEVRQALNLAVDRQKIIEEVLKGYGQKQYSPVPSHLLSDSSISQTDNENYESRVNNARKILTDNGWVPNADGIMEKNVRNGTTTLAFTLTTSDNEELKEAAFLIEEMWEEIGANAEVEVHEASALNQSIIRPRKYEALLFGEVLGPEIDLYPFWHSSQRNDPGLNIAMYTSLNADRALEKARVATDNDRLLEAYREFNREVMEDVPAVFLYSPQYVYVVPKKLQGFSSTILEGGEFRFNMLQKSYLEEKRVLKSFN
jgi:peptide/nickel transport system substrate-binding protein